MSEALDRVSGLEYIPIFPLPLVLMPFELQPLHIFEPKYRQMLKDIELRRNMFGINLFEPGSEFDTMPEPGSIGCVGEVRETTTLPDGRSNILTFGLVRYRILNYVDHGCPYLTAEIEFFEDIEGDAKLTEELGNDVYSMFDRVAKAAFKLSGSRGQIPEVPRTEPEQLSFLVAAAFNLGNKLKYELVTMQDTAERLTRLRGILQEAVKKMESNAEIVSAAQMNGHSKTPIDPDAYN